MSEAKRRTVECGCVVFGAAQFCPLHSAAPDMLKALEAALPLLERFARHTEANFGMVTADQRKVIEDARAAIAKAKSGTKEKKGGHRADR